MKNETISAFGQSWLVREATTRAAAMDAIAMAACRGSVGSRTVVNDEVQADVVALNADGTERKPS